MLRASSTEINGVPTFTTTNEKENMDEKTFIADPNDYADEAAANIEFMAARKRECASGSEGAA